MLDQVLDRILVDDFRLVNTIDLIVFNDEAALFVDCFFNVGNGVLNGDDPFHVDNLFMELAGEHIPAVVGVLHVGVEIIRGKVGGEMLLHVFIGTIILIKIFQNNFTSIIC